jgi:hypothetical protein
MLWLFIKINADRYNINKNKSNSKKRCINGEYKKTKDNCYHCSIVIHLFYFCFGSGGFASLGGNAA